MAATEMLNKIFQGEVAAVHNYGAFVRLPGMGRTQGLVHKSQISMSRVDDATEVLELNEKVWFKVISVTEDCKIGLSMKVVDQGTGRDLDPNGVQCSLDAQQRKEKLLHGESKSIQLDAIYKTTCSKCGVPGHLAKNCFQTPEGKSYELLPEPEPEKKIFGSIQDRLQRLAGAGVAIPPEQVDAKKEDKLKKKKKRKKKDSSSDEEDAKSKKKKSKSKRKREASDSSDSEPRKKGRKKRRHSSDSDSSASEPKEKKLKEKRHKKHNKKKHHRS